MNNSYGYLLQNIIYNIVVLSCNYSRNKCIIAHRRGVRNVVNPHVGGGLWYHCWNARGSDNVLRLLHEILPDPTLPPCANKWKTPKLLQKYNGEFNSCPCLSSHALTNWTQFGCRLSSSCLLTSSSLYLLKHKQD